MATYQIWNEDCIKGMAERLEPNSVDLTVTSIPFEALFVYSNKLEDLGNNGTSMNLREGRFALNLTFFIEGLLRVHRPGTNACIHLQQLLSYQNQHGVIGRRDFRGAVIDMFLARGWTFFGEVAIGKNPQVVAQRLKLHSLQFKTGHSRTATNLAPFSNDYILIFQKPGDIETQVRAIKHNVNPTGWVTQEEWIHWARGTWDDIEECDVLENSRNAREDDREKHVCPLQLEPIRRLVALYSNPVSRQENVTVLDPFMGIGSTAWICLGGESMTTGKKKLAEQRNVVGFELKDSYHAIAVENCERALTERKEEQKSLFDCMAESK